MLLLRSETYLVLWHNFTMGPFYKDIFYVIPFSQIIQKNTYLWVPFGKGFIFCMFKLIIFIPDF